MSTYNIPLIKIKSNPPPYSYYQQPITTSSETHPVNSPDIIIIPKNKIERKNCMIICGASLLMFLVIVLLVIYTSNRS
jgi:hypothetical protein